MKVSHRISAVFDDPNLIGAAGLVPVMWLAESAGLAELTNEHVSVPNPNPVAKVGSVVAGMVAGADSIDDLDVLRHGAMPTITAGVRAPSTLGTFLRAFTFGHVRQLDAVASRFLAGLCSRVPRLLAGADQLVYVDIDDTVRETHGYAKQGTAYGYSGVKGVNAQLAAVSTPITAPVIAAARLRRGNVASGHGGAHLARAAISTVRAATTTGQVLVRADSGYYDHAFIGAAIGSGAWFSVTARMNPSVKAAIAAIDQDAWAAIHYPNAIWDEDEQRLISDAQVAEIDYVAFTSKSKRQRVPCRLVVRRVKRLNPRLVDGQDELFATYRYHAFVTNSTLSTTAADATHRDHAIIEQVIAELKDGPLAHAPSSRFAANGAWLALATIAFNLARAAGVLASTRHAKARWATLRRHLVNVPARLATSGRAFTMHLPRDWPWADAWQALFAAAASP